MELLVYKASAGSGKTFTLAVEYIKHLILNPRAYRQILAVTFTNKATAEMKRRILEQLYGIWRSDPASDVYLAAVKNKLGSKAAELTDELLRQRAGQALLLMLHDYGRFRVETIDSFFQSVMRNLARELELNPNLNIELNNSEVLSDAVDSMIEKLTPDSPVLAWLLEYINERIADDKRWNVADEIKRFGNNIFDESYIERGELLRQKLRDPQTIRLYREALKEQQTEALEQMRGFYEQFQGELEAHGLSEDDLSNKNKGISSYFRKLGNGCLTDKEVKNPTLLSHLENTEKWVSKSHKQRADVLRLVESSLHPLLQEAERMRPSRNRIVNSCRLSLQHINKLQLLNHIDEEVRALNHRYNRFLLSDTNTLLHSLMREGDSSFVFEKIGTQIRTVMIDEFQDTSRMQWDNFRLLLLEGLSQGADSLIVGDVKQSIYRWRNGDWGILNSLRDSSRFPVRVETLQMNHRSEPRIIHFNNALFQEAVSCLNEVHDRELNEECLPLKQAYEDVVQIPRRKEQRGYVKAHFIHAENREAYTQQTLSGLAEEVQRLLAEGIRLNDIALLVRKNKTIPTIAEYFDKELGLLVVSDEAFRLDASPAVCRLIDALRWLANPEDRVAIAALGLEEEEYNAFTECLPELRALPLYELLEELYSLLELKTLEKQEAYLFSFFDAVTEYLTRNASDIDAFLRHWDETLSGKTIPGGDVEGIRIYSIHKSKGLEFHTVLIPFCDWKLENETNNQLVWCTPPLAPYNALDLVPVNYSAAMAESVYRQAYLDERLQLWVDSLNLLYVAFTRAEKNLILWGEQSEREQLNTVSDLLTHTLTEVAAKLEGAVWDAEEGRFAYGEIVGSTLPAKVEEAQTMDANRLRVQPLPMPVQMESRKPCVEFRQSNCSAEFISGVEEGQSWRRFINRGNLLHYLFSNIETEADVENAVSRLLFEGVIGDREQETEVRELAVRALQLPQVRDWYSGTWQLFNECDIIWLNEQGELCNRRPDRVMMRGNDIVVVDFKFGQPLKSHHRQVQGYIRLLRRMGYTSQHISGYLWYVDEARVVEVTMDEDTRN